MKWRTVVKPPLVEGDKLDLTVLSPGLKAIIKTILGKLDKQALGQLDQEQLSKLYEALEGESYTIVTRGMFGDYSPPIEYIKALPPNRKRK